MIARAINIHSPPGGEASPAADKRCKEAEQLLKRLGQRREEVLRFMSEPLILASAHI